MNRLFLSFLFVFLVWPSLTWAEVAKINFTTDPQTVAPGVISGDITVQTQNDSGTEEKTPETIDLIFSSDSTTGEFVNKTGEAVSKTMNKNSANRTFYYRDSALGGHQLTVSATGRDSKKTFSATQTITISVVSEVATSSDNASATTTATTQNNTNYTSGGGSYSAHSGQGDLSDLESSAPPIGAGRARLSIVGSGVNFEAWDKNGGSTGRFVWSFGDGSSEEGRKVVHTYQFPGEYQVILNGYFYNGQSTARTKVLVSKPEVIISDLNLVAGYVELQNKGTQEVNLGAWTVSGFSQKFILPTDTIIAAGAKIKLPVATTTLASGDSLSLSVPTGKIVSRLSDLRLSSLAYSRQAIDPETYARRQRLVASIPDEPVELKTPIIPNLKPDNQDKNTITEKIILTPQLSWWQKAVRMFR
jgi:hypothetical protein